MASGFLIITFSRAIGVAALFIYGVFIARLESAETFAKIQLILTFCTLFGFVVSAGFETTVIRFASNYWTQGCLGQAKSIYNQAVKKIIINTFIFTTIYLALVALKLLPANISDSIFLIAVLLGIPLFAISSINRDILRSRGSFFYSILNQNILRTILPLLTSVLVVIIDQTIFDEVLAVLLLIVSMLIGFLIDYFLVNRTKIFSVQRDRSNDDDHQIFAKTIFYGDIVHILLYRSPALIIGAFFDLKIAAIYLAAERVSAASQFIVEGVQIACGPRIAIAQSGDKFEELQDAISMTSFLALLSGMPLVVGTVIFGNYVIALFGEGFSDSYLILIIMTLGYSSISLFGPTPMYANMTGLEVGRTKVTLAALVFLIISMAVAIFAKSLVLAAVGVSISLFILYAATAMLIVKKRGLRVGIFAINRKNVSIYLKGAANYLNIALSKVRRD